MTKSVQPQLSPEEFDAQFREIANQLRVAPIETIDDCYARLLKLLSYSEATLVAFLKRCTGAQLQTALTALDMAVVVQASPAVVEALEQTARRLPEYDLESCLLAARSAFAKKIVFALNGTDDATRQERFAELFRQAEKGKASAQFRVNRLHKWNLRVGALSGVFLFKNLAVVFAKARRDVNDSGSVFC